MRAILCTLLLLSTLSASASVVQCNTESLAESLFVTIDFVDKNSGTPEFQRKTVMNIQKENLQEFGPAVWLQTNVLSTVEEIKGVTSQIFTGNNYVLQVPIWGYETSVTNDQLRITMSRGTFTETFPNGSQASQTVQCKSFDMW